MLGKNGQMPPFGVPKVAAVVPAASLSRQKRGKTQNPRHFVSHLGNLGRHLTLTLQKYGRAGCREGKCRSHSSFARTKNRSAREDRMARKE
jgi:hypothetical protein